MVEQATSFSSPQLVAAMSMSREERRKKRQKRANAGNGTSPTEIVSKEDEKFSMLLARNEDDLLQFVAKVNKVYQDILHRPAPFMTFVFCGMQSAGKSTIMERFLNSVVNIVQEGTGTRCPLDATCIHEASCTTPRCELGGSELPDGHVGSDLTASQVFERITEHNKRLGTEDRFSTEPLYLVYRASNVQNMRFVDTPGIISNQSTGRDNREDIKTILRSEMRKPNTKLCVLLEPKEFATNPIVEFCDDSLGGRDKWIPNATFLMTKFDKQLGDARTGTKANSFFAEFFGNECYPHLVITPTLAREDLPPEQLFEARSALIQGADEYEKDRFEDWQEGHERFRQEFEGNDEVLDSKVATRIGFPTAKQTMREIMLRDTVERLPEVLNSLRRDLAACQEEHQVLKDKMKFTSPSNLRTVVIRMLHEIQEKILGYLDGNINIALKFPQALQSLDDEIDDEEDSDWADKELNFHSSKEEHWRGRIAELAAYPGELSADRKYIGGKQFQRALEFFRVVMIDSLPDPYELRELVPNATGFLSGGLMYENWERAMVEITKVCLKDVSHPGLNFLIKHVGSIFRRLFIIALDDIKEGEESSKEFKLIPRGVELFMIAEYDAMLWDLLVKVGGEVHSSLEPMYSSIDPNLPTFHGQRLGQEDYYIKKGEKYVKATSDPEEIKQNWYDGITNRLSFLVTGSGTDAKSFLKAENNRRARTKRSFLPDERAAMITDDEIDTILRRSFEYIVGLLEFNLIVFRFQLNHHLFQGFKTMLKKDLMQQLTDADWEALVQPDPTIKDRLIVLDTQIKGLNDSLIDVQRMQRSL